MGDFVASTMREVFFENSENGAAAGVINNYNLGLDLGQFKAELANRMKVVF